MAVSYLDSNGLLYFWNKIKALVSGAVSTKQDTINDLADIRSGASKGATAVQEESDPVFGASAAAGIKSTDITNWNSKTSNVGTVTKVKINGTEMSPNSSGVVDIGTVITTHQDINGKVDKTTTVNGHALSGNVTVTKSDVSLGNVTNDAQVKRTEMGAANGVATLGSDGKVPSSQLPSYVDDVIEAYPRSGQAALSSTWLATGSASGTVITPEGGKIYILMADTTDYKADTQFRWSGTVYSKMNDGGVSAISNAEIDTIVGS